MGVIILGHHNNGKQKHNSSEVSPVKNTTWNNIPDRFKEADIWSWNIEDLIVTGVTKEEAYDDFIRKAKIYFDEIEKLAKTALETDILKNSIKEVDCFGEEIKK